MPGVKVKESKIAGLGLFTDQEFNEGDMIGIAHIDGQPTNLIGKYHNHSESPNAHSILLGNKRYIAALRPLSKGEEITVDYRKQPELEQPEEFAKGGSVSMPKASKKGLASKRYTKDLTGTNRLFTKNALLKKPKSKKNRVYDPNAKYYDEGGITSQEEIDAANRAMMKARLAYANMHGNPAAQRMIVAPDQPYDFGNGVTGTHYMASMDDYAVPQIQDVNGQLMLGDYGPESAEAIRFDNPEDAMYFAENYKNVSPAFLNEKAKGGALLTKKVTCKKCGWKWDAADGGNDITTCHKCGGQGLVHAKNGTTVDGDEPKGRKKTKFQPGTYDPNETAGYMLDEQEVTVKGKASNWGKARTQYKERHPEEQFINKKKRQYLKNNKNLIIDKWGTKTGYGNKNAISSYDWPDYLVDNFKKEYDYKTNTAVVKNVSRKEGWNPNKRTQYVGDLNDTQRGIVAESKYGSKLQPTYWDRTLAGLATFASKFSPELQDAMNKGNMPGLTKKESQEILNAKMTKIPFTDIDLPFSIPTGGLESFSALEIPGTFPANYLKNTGLSSGSSYKEIPSWYSGEKMANVTDTDVTALNPLTYAGLEAIPELGINLAKGTYKLGKTGINALETGYEAAKVNPQSWFQTPEQLIENPNLYRGLQGETTWKDPLGKLDKFIYDTKIKNSYKRENNLLEKYPGFEGSKMRKALSAEEEMHRFNLEKAAEAERLRRSQLPIKPIMSEKGTHLGGGQGRLYVNTLDPNEVVKIGTFPGTPTDLENLIQTGKNLEGMPSMENVAFPTKGFTIDKAPLSKAFTNIHGNSEAVQFMPWKGNPLNVDNPVNIPLGSGIPSAKAKRELQFMAQTLDDNKVGMDFYGQNNFMYDPASDSYKLVDLNYVDDPKSVFEWNQLNKPVKQRIEDKFGYEIPQGELPLELEFANSKSIKPLLGEKIGDNTGRFNLGVYNFKDYPQYIAKVEDPAAVAATQGLDAEQYMSAMVDRTKNLDPSEFSKVFRTVEGKEGKRVLVMPKLRGTLGSKLDTETLMSIPDQSYTDFYDKLKLLRDEGLNYDFYGDNFMYDPYTEKFNLFDFSPQSAIDVEPGYGNKQFFETEVFGRGNPNIYGKEQAGKNLKDALGKRLTRTYMESFPGDQEVYGLDEYNKRITDILSGLSPQKYGGIHNWF
jgi:hypothetical protein